MRGMKRPTHISLSATARLLGVDVARVYRLARQGKFGTVIHPRVPGEEAAVPVLAIERYALRVFTDAELQRACNPTEFDLGMQELRQTLTDLYPRRRRRSRYHL